MSNRNRITIERVAADDEAAFLEVFELLIDLHKEGGYGVLDAAKMAEGCYRTIAEGMCFVARSGNGKAIGTLALIEASFWYSDTTYLIDRWFYVRPANRKKTVGTALLRAARDEAQAHGIMCFIEIDNPDRKPKHTRQSLVAQKAGFIPLGYTLKVG